MPRTSMTGRSTGRGSRLVGVSAGVLTALAVATTFLIAAPAQAAVGRSRPPVKIYVSPTKGYDNGPGTPDRPFRTLDEARNRVRSINRNMQSDIDVELLGGTYTLASTFTLTSADSGTNGHRVVYEAAPGANPVISGGATVSGWSAVDSTGTVYKTHLGFDTRQLYVNGELETRARGTDNPAGFTKTATGYTITDTSLDTWKNQSDIEVVSRWGWMMYRCPVQSIVGTTMTMQQPCFHNANLHQGQEIQNPTWLENAHELLNTPGEWYLDQSTHELYYMPKAGQSMATATVTVPRLQDLIDLNGTISQPVSNVSFHGLTFSYSTWLAPSSTDGLVEGQAGFRIVGSNNPDFDSTRLNWVKTPGAINVSYGHSVTFEENTFTHLGAVGLNLNTGSQAAHVEGNTFSEIAATGIQVGGTDVIDAHPTDTRSITKDNTVDNNVVTKVADQYNGSLGIFAGYTDHTVITHNKVYNLPYSGISVGWGWGLTDQGGDTNYPGNSGVPVYNTPTTSRDNIVTDNQVSDIMQHQADGGAIYTLSANPGGIVAGNYISNVPPPAYGAIYQDEGSRYWKTTGNAFCNIAYQWLLMNHGMDITATNNFTTQPAYTTQANSTGDVVTDNTTVDGCAQLPASIVDNAGLQPAFRYLDPDPSSADQQAPTVPGKPTAATQFPTVADLSWSGSQDDTAVTGYSIFANGKLISASTGPSVRVTGLTSGATYQFVITARDAAGNESAPSPALSVTMPAGSDLAKGKAVTVSSYSEPNSAELAVDGDLSTRWAQGLGLPDPSWIQVDLGAQYDVTGAITTFEKSSGYSYRIQVSSDEFHWRTLDDHTSTATTAATNYSPAASPVTGRYVRLTITGSNGNGGSIYELEVYGNVRPPSTDQLAPSAPGQPTVTPRLPSMADLSWQPATDDTGVTTYEVYQDGKRIAVTDQTTLRVTGLTPETPYSFTIVARDAALNESAPSTAGTVTMPADNDLARGKPVTVSSYSQPNTPDLAVDGNLSTRWAQGLGQPDPSWIQVDLGSVTSVSSVVTTFEKPSGYKYLLEYSSDGTSWSTLEDHTADNTTSSATYSFAASSVQARYVRLTVTGSSYNGGSIYELQVYGGF